MSVFFIMIQVFRMNMSSFRYPLYIMLVLCFIG